MDMVVGEQVEDALADALYNDCIVASYNKIFTRTYFSTMGQWRIVVFLHLLQVVGPGSVR
jgi:hypothetical protein